MRRVVLVVGATGILAPAVAALRQDGSKVIPVSRRGGAGSIALDARASDALVSGLSGRRWDDALLYGPAMSERSIRTVQAMTPSRVVVVRTSADADSAHGPLDVPPDTLQLGWTTSAPYRWHTPSEVSAAALQVLADGVPRILGRVRPWGDRP